MKTKFKVGKNQNSGITLIVLVIIVIVLLIVAGVVMVVLTNVTAIMGENNKETLKVDTATDEILKKATVGRLATSLSTIDGNQYSSSNPPIPQGYIPINTSAIWDGSSPEYNKGLVISDSTTADSGNEWVWIPVVDATTMYTTGTATLDKTTVITSKYSKSNIISETTRVRPGKTGDNSYREPDILSHSAADTYYYKTMLGFENIQKMAETFVNEYNTMIASIEKYGGFYIGRYELSSNGVKKNQEPLTNVNWYNLYNNCKNLAQAGSNTISGMIYGCQWDVICNWLSESGYNISDSINWGNYKNSTVIADDGITVLKASGTPKSLNTGVTTYTKANNIYDLAGNAWEWTQEAHNIAERVFRGGSFFISIDGTSNTSPFSFRYPVHPINTSEYFRFSSNFNIKPIINNRYYTN